MKKITTVFLLLILVKSYAQREYYTTMGKDMLTKREVKNRVKTFKKMGEKAYTGFVIRNTRKTKDSIIHKVTFKKDEKVFLKMVWPSFSKKFEEKELPYFSLKTLMGETLNSDQLKRKPTMINFWYTKCVPCIQEMPYLNELKKKYKDQVNFIAITFDKKDKVNAFLEKRDFDFSHVIDAKDYINKLELKVYPMNLFLDKNGVLKYVKMGIPHRKEGEEYLNDEAINEIIEIIKELK